jgi:hypothetical protein
MSDTTTVCPLRQRMIEDMDGAARLPPIPIAATLCVGTKRKCPNARVFPNLGADRLCHSPVGHSRT